MTSKRTEPATDCGGKATAVVPSKRRRRGNGQQPPPAPALPAPPQPSTLMQAIIAASSDPAVDVGKVGELVKLHQDLQAREWQRAFNEAMVACQTDLQPVARNKSNEQTSSRYADLARLAEAALPIIHTHGFAITFSEAETQKPNHIGVAVSVRHRDGHTERFAFHVPVDLCGFKGTPNKTAIHGWGSALTYCRRYALLCAFNVIVSGDDDANAAGKVPSSAPVKRENVWSTFQGEMRAAKSLPALQAVVVKWRPRVINWSEKWKGAAESLHGQCHARLSGTRPAPKDSTAP